MSSVVRIAGLSLMLTLTGCQYSGEVVQPSVSSSGGEEVAQRLPNIEQLTTIGAGVSATWIDACTGARDDLPPETTEVSFAVGPADEREAIHMADHVVRGSISSIRVADMADASPFGYLEYTIRAHDVPKGEADVTDYTFVHPVCSKESGRRLEFEGDVSLSLGDEVLALLSSVGERSYALVGQGVFLVDDPGFVQTGRGSSWVAALERMSYDEVRREATDRQE